ncbi:type II secretion system GspH family protein [Massilia sp. MB5]|uniref:type II secretion system protein n=1 Tax=Massilia sp. MB5 TaxID=2919578 RepID=UPI001F0D9EB8|nr:type II secretion system protein [Massilia sp. MB5]UMR30071.1 type II secretion system GspH family protein [Massilia sp. MB5]
MRRQQGFSYLIVMFLVAMLTLASVRALQVTLVNEQREREAELLLVGMAYRNAIRSYYQNATGSARQLPKDGKALLDDGRGQRTEHHLRKRFRDPMTAEAWEEIYENDFLIGVVSRSSRKPIKKSGFPPELADFSKARTYRDWKFIYRPE